MVIDQGNFHIVDNALNFINISELTHLPKSTESHLGKFVDFISGHRF